MSDTVTVNFFVRRREELGLSQRALAMALGVTNTSVSAWEKGLSAPRITSAAKLALVYRVTPDRMRREIAALADSIMAAKAEA